MLNPVVFADESGLGERYIVFGALFVPGSRLVAVEAELNAFCNTNGFSGRELSWKKASPRESARYANFAERLWYLTEGASTEFRAMVVDTHQNPLKHEASGATTQEIGFYKFYHIFLTRSLALVSPTANSSRLHVADLADQYIHRTEVLTKTVSAKLRKLLPGSFDVAEIARSSPRDSRAHQLADLLTGAVAYRLNGRASHKEQICKAVEARVGQRLDEDILPNRKPFNVWGFAAKGQRRWTRGSSGTV